MRKSLIAPVATVQSSQLPEQEWLDIEHLAKVEVTSEDPNLPIESALVSSKEPGWRAAARGEQILTRKESSATSGWSFPRRKASEPRNSLFVGRPSRMGPSVRSFASNGPSARRVLPPRSKITGSV